MRLRAATLGAALLASTMVVAQSASHPAKSSAADDPATHEQVLEFLQIMDLRKQLNAIVPVMQQQIQKSAAQLQEQFPSMDAEDAAFMTSEQQAMFSGLFKRLPISDIEEAIIPVYQRHFTRPEMDAILVFYESPAGRKMRAELPAMLGEQMEIMNRYVQPVLDDVMREMQQRMEEHIRLKKAKEANSPK